MATNDTNIDVTDATAVSHSMRAMKRHIETLMDENRRLTSALADARIERAAMYEKCKPFLELPW